MDLVDFCQVSRILISCTKASRLQMDMHTHILYTQSVYSYPFNKLTNALSPTVTCLNVLTLFTKTISLPRQASVGSTDGISLTGPESDEACVSVCVFVAGDGAGGVTGSDGGYTA